MKDRYQLIQDIIGLQKNLDLLVLSYEMKYWMKLEKLGLTINQLDSLILIQSRGKTSYKDLANALGTSRSNVIGLADKLIKNGFLTCNQDSENRRVQYLMLTEKGREITSDVKQAIKKEVTKLLTPLTVEDLATLNKILSVLNSAN